MTTNWQDPAGTPPQPPNGGNHYQSKGKRFAIVAILLVVIAGLGTAAGLVMVNRNSDDVADSPQYVVMDIADTTPVFEPRDAVGNDPFFHLDAQLAVYQEEVEEQIDQQVAIAQANADPGDTVVRPEFDVAALDAAVKTGLYGGTEENTCDPERLISFLYAHPDIGEQWAKIQNIDFDEIASYIRSLEVRVLAEPVNVLNHGYDADIGAAYEIDTVLDAGTAVLVDENGDVRTRCYCGNPIKPKPPEHMPPRCLVFGALVYTEPAGSTKREDVARDVLLTGRQATANGGTWIEVKWGTGDNQVGWTQANNLRKSYCPTPTNDRFCPGPGATNVWHMPDMTSQVGQVTGKVRTHDTTLDIFAPINPVGGIGNEVINNDFMLIRFTEANPSVQNSAWVKLADLNQDQSECQRIRQCVDSDGPIMDRAGGGAVVSPDGVQWVEFTGHFIGDPLVTFAEVRVNDGTGNYGWMSNFYTPLTDEECQPPVYDCIEEGILWNESTGNTIADAKGQLVNVEVTIIGGPQDGRIEVQIDAPTGPTGWVDANAFYDGHSDCRPVPDCYETTGMAWTEFSTNGVSIPATGPTTISQNGALVFDAGIVYVWINIGGTDYWIDISDLNSLPAEDCIPDEDPECEMGMRGPLDDITPTLREVETLDEATESREMTPDEGRALYRPRCCVDALYNSTNVGDPSADAVPRWVTVVGSSDVAGVTWFDTFGPRYFRQADVVDPSECERPECPEGTRVPGRDDRIRRLEEVDLVLSTGRVIEPTPLRSLGEPRLPGGGVTPVGGECCVSALYSAQGLGLLPLISPVFVEIASGPHGMAPAWYQTTDGTWFPETAIVNDEQCRPDWECPTDEEPERDPRDEIFYGELDELSSDAIILETAVDRLVGIPSTWCCVDGNVYDDIDGALKGTLDGPTLVILVESNEDGTWHRIIIDGPLGGGWVMTDQFLPKDDCRPGDNCLDLLTGKVLNPAELSLSCCAEVLVDGGVSIEIVTLTGETRETEAGTEYLTTDGEWVLVIAFLPDELCRPDGGNCPDFSLIDVQALAAGEIEICCIAVGDGFEAAGLTGETREGPEGTEYERNDGTWIPESAFVGAGRCLPDPECPTVSLISPNDPLTCCVSLGNGEFEEVTLNGEQRETDEGTEYQATNGEWYLFPDDFVGAGRCGADSTPCNGTIVAGECCERPNVDYQGQCVPPCPTGSVRNANGDCVVPETPCPTGTVRNNAGECVTPACEDTDDDGICDTDDNCDFNPNRDQADADQDGAGDACDPCTDADGDLFCETPGDPNNDNCWGEWNPDQTDVDGDGVGDACDNCPNTRNADQANSDGVGTGDACEQPDCPRSPTGAPGDIDGDGVCNDDDNCPQDPNPGQEDTFGQQGQGDACETRCPTSASVGNGDLDNDGVCNNDDNCPNTANPGQQNSDDDVYGDACDLCPGFGLTNNFDSDGDGWGDDCDTCPGPNGLVNAAQIPNPDQGFLYDTNNDGVRDSCFEPFGITNPNN